MFYRFQKKKKKNLTLTESQLLHSIAIFQPHKETREGTALVMFSLIRMLFNGIPLNIKHVSQHLPASPPKVIHKVFCKSEGVAEEQHSRMIVVLRYRKQQQ